MGCPKKEQDEVIEDYERTNKRMAEHGIRRYYRAEGPQHEVELSGFYLGIHEVTQKQFKAVMGYNPSCFSKDGTGKPGVKYGVVMPAVPRTGFCRHERFSGGERVLAGSERFCRKADGDGRQEPFVDVPFTDGSRMGVCCRGSLLRTSFTISAIPFLPSKPISTATIPTAGREGP